MLSLTPSATAAAKEALASSGEKHLRVGVRGGGCSGLSYVIDIDARRPADIELDLGDGMSVVIDPKSSILLNGCTLDHIKTLVEAGFRVDNPGATAQCGCGNSFSI